MRSRPNRREREFDEAMAALIATAIFALVLGALLVTLKSRDHDDSRARARAMLKLAVRRQEALPEEQILRVNPRGDESRLFLNNVYQLKLLTRFQEMIWQSGLSLHVSQIMLVVVGTMGTVTVIVNALWHDLIFAAAAGTPLGILPIVYIGWRRKKRLRAFAQQLPFALDLIKSSLQAGHSLPRGLQVTAQEFTDPLGGEFRVVLEQTQLGMPLPQALDHLLLRVPEDDLRLLIVAVKVQNEVGSSLAQIVGRLSEIVRTRQRLQAQIRTMTAQSRMSGIVVGLLPVFVLGAFSLMQPSYTHLLFFDPIGVKVLKGAVLLDVLALITIRRILRVDF